MAKRIAQAIIDDVAEEYSSGYLKGLFRRMRQRSAKASRAAAKRLSASLLVNGVPSLPDTDQHGKIVHEPHDVILSKAIKTQADVEEAIARIRERQIKTVAPAQALLDAVMGHARGNVTVEFAPESDEEPKDTSDT